MNVKTKRLLSVALTLCMLLTLLPVTAMADNDASAVQTQATEVVKGSAIPGTGYHVTSVKNYSIAPDISERVIITNNDAGNSQTVANVMEVNTSGGRAKIVAGYGNRNPKEQGWMLKTTTDQAHTYEKESGLNVVGGVNASWFNINTGEPSGYLVMNGVVHHDNSSRAFVAAFDDGSVNVFKEGTTLAQAEASQSEKQGKTVKILEAVDALVAMVWDGEVIINESGNGGYYPRTCVGVKADGTVVLFQADGTMAPRSVGYTAREEANMMVALGCVAAIQLDEGGSSTYVSQREGESDLTMRNTPAGGSERVVSGTILVVSTVAASGEFDHASITPDEEYYTPNSTVTMTASAMDFSGAPAASLPEDVSFAVSDESMGTIGEAAVSGSTATATFTSSGKTGDVTVNLVSGSRTVGSAVLHIQNPDSLSFTSSETSLNYGETSGLGLIAKYQGETVQLKDSDIKWDILSANYGGYDWTFTNGTLNGGVSVSGTGLPGKRVPPNKPTHVYGYIISAAIENGTVTSWTLSSEFNASSGSAPVEVNKVLSDITWSKDESGRLVGTFTHEGDTVTFIVDVPVLTGELQSDGTVQWTAQLAVGSFNGLTFTATSERTSTIVMNLRAGYGDLTAEIQVSIGVEPKMVLDGGDGDGWDYSTIGTTVESFDGMASNAVATYHYAGRGGVVKGSVVSDTDDEFADIVRFGHKAIKLEYDWSGISGTDGACIGLGGNLAVSGTPTAIGVWVYLPEGTPVPWLRAQIATSTDGGNTWTNAYVNFSAGSAATGEGLKDGWQYLEADLTSYAGALIRINSGMLFRAMVTTGGIGWYTTDGTKLDKGDLKGYILLDNLCIVYGANNQDVTAPVVTSIQLVNDDGTKVELEDGATLDSGKLRFFVTYNDSEETDPYATGVESAYFYFDGTYRGVYDKDILGSTSGLMHFSNGIHSITFYLKDGYGNVTRETRYFTVEAAEADLPNIALEAHGAPIVGKTWELDFVSDGIASITSLTANVSVTRSYPVKDVTFPDGVTGTWSYDAAKGVVTVEITGIGESFKADKLATIVVEVPTATTEGSSINVQVTKGSYGCKQTADLDISDLNQYATGFTTQISNHPVEAMYRIKADNAVVGSTAAATVTVIKDDKAAVGVNVYANDELLGVTDEKGQIDISSLTKAQGSVNLRADDKDGNRSFMVTLFSYNAVGDESGLPFNINFNFSQSYGSKNVTWMSNPSTSAEKAVAEISTDAELKDAVTVNGTSTLISYSSSNQITRVNSVTLTGLTAGTTYYYRVGDGEKWSDIRSFTTPGGSSFFLLADIQEEAALEGMGRIAACLNDQYPFGIQLGDAVDNVRYFNQWQDALSLFTEDGLKNSDILHVIGNHEADDDGNDAIAAKTTFGIPAAWYSVERGDVYIAVLNHTSNKDSLQQFADWLVADAAKSDCVWKVLVTHVPAYYTNPTGGGETYNQYLPAACDAAGIDFYFSGNDHSYARTAPMTDGQVNEAGTVYYICGSTGGKSYSIVNNPDFNFEVATLDFTSVYMDFTADKYEATVTTYNVATDGSRTVLDQYKRIVPECENDEHTYVYDGETGTLECSVCRHTENAAEVQYTGWATDKATDRKIYFAAGRWVTGYLFLDGKNYNFDSNGLAYEGEYTIGGETCTFTGGEFVPNDKLALAGICGADAWFVLYQDGRMVIGGTGALSSTSRATVPWQTVKDKVVHVTVGAGITEISTQCFYYCSLMTDLTFEKGSELVAISGSAFNGCTRLAKINLENCEKLTLIGGSAFYDCNSLTDIVLPDSLRTINGNAFARCKSLRSVYMPDSIQFIPASAFKYSENVVLSVSYDSYALQYAIKNGIAYVLREAGVVASGSCGDNAAWELYSDGTLNITGSGALYNAKLASDIAWYANRNLIRVVNIDAGITNLPDFVFSGCTYLEAVNFAEGSKLATIGGSAFRGCTALTELTLPDGMQTIYGNAFRDCSALASVYLPDSISYMSGSAFSSCSKVVLSVGANSYAKDFAVNNGIKYVERQVGVIASGSCGANAKWEVSSDGILNITGSGALTSPKVASGIAWYDYRSMIRVVNIDAGITNLPDFAFFGCTALETVNFTENSSLTTIGGSALRGCTALTELTLPDGVQTIYGNAIRDCSALTSVYLPDSISYMSASVFSGCANVVLSVGENSYAKDFAVNNNIKYVERQTGVIPSGSCGTDAAWELSSDGTLNITGSGALTNAKVASDTAWHSYRSMIRVVNISAGITNLPDFAFFGCTSLEAVNFAENSSLTTIGGSALRGCSALTELTLPDGIQTIYGNAFRDCTALTSVYLPDSVSYMASSAFSGCANVVLSVGANSYAKEFAVNNGIQYTERQTGVIASGSCGTDAAWELSSDGTLNITGSGALTNAKVASDTAWYNYRHMIRVVNVDAGITNLPDFAFYGCTALETVSFAENSSLTTIGGSALRGCSALTELVLPDGLKTVYGNALRDCSALTSVYLPDSVSYMASSAFSGCANVVLSVAEGSYAEQWAITNNVKYVNHGSETTTLEAVEEPETTVPVEETPAVEETANVCGDELTWKLDEKTLTISGRGGMYSYDADNAAPWAAYADNIENIVIEKHVKTIGAYAFSGLEKLVSVSFDEESELEVIEEYAFAGCKELTEIKLPEKLEKLGEAAFAGCEKLRSVELPESLVEFEIITIKPENEEELEDREPVEIFDGCDMSILTLTVVKGSAAEAYAVDNGITIVYAEEEVSEPVEEVTEAPAEEIPAEETPAEEAPVEETPAPAKESPAETPAPETEPAPDTQPEE